MTGDMEGTLRARASSPSWTAFPESTPADRSMAATSASMSVCGWNCAVRAAVVVAGPAAPRGLEKASVGASLLACRAKQVPLTRVQIQREEPCKCQNSCLKWG